MLKYFLAPLSPVVDPKFEKGSRFLDVEDFSAVPLFHTLSMSAQFTDWC